MKKVSDKQDSINRQLGLLKKKKLKECGHRCSCGSTFMLDLSHLISKGQGKTHELNPLNSVIDCRNCHIVWERGTWEEKEKLVNFYQRLKNMKIVDEADFNRLTINMPDWIMDKFNEKWK
jgi:5-methylcytosine-specific restriction endonuclease McrA